MTINTLSLMAATTAVVWAVAPNRSFGPPTLPFQRAFQSLPSNVFDMSGPMRKYSLGSRLASYATKVGIPSLRICNSRSCGSGDHAIVGFCRPLQSDLTQRC